MENGLIDPKFPDFRFWKLEPWERRNLTACVTSNLQTDPEGGADHVDVAGPAMSIVLAQVVEIRGELFVPHFTDTRGKTIPHPGVETPIIENFVRSKNTEPGFAEFHRMINLQPVTITG